VQEIARDAFSRKEPHRYNAEARQLIVGTRSFARRLGYDQQHAEHVRELRHSSFRSIAGGASSSGAIARIAGSRRIAA